MSAKSRPTVSVVIPAYGNPNYVNHALDSVRKQTLTDFEVILVDDCSGDECVSRYELDAKTRLIRHAERRGPAAARNTGIKESEGRCIALLDMDDVWLPDKLASQVAALDSNPDAGMTFCHFTLVDANLKPLSRQPKPNNVGPNAFKRLLAGNVVKSCSVAMLTRDALDRCGLFDELLSGTDDWDLWLRISRSSEVISDPSPLVLYRVHTGQFSHDSAAMRRAEVAVGEKWLVWAECSDRKAIRAVNRSLSHKLQRLAGAEARRGDIAAAFRALYRAVRANPWDPRSYPRPPLLLFAALLSLLRQPSVRAD